ncbi:MAG: FadR family transcriptional regulator [Chloroflexi bacterium]|nr:MAG: FadR family transcriptional regulator [Chloroflexota bacterium]
MQSEQAAVFAPIRPVRASSDVIAQIRRAILSGQFRPGDRLPTERDMAQQFGVSRVTVRDALRALEANGLIRVKVGGQGGPYVSEPDIALLSDSIGTHLHLRGTTFEELAEARQALETTAAHLAAQRATAEDLAALEAAIHGPMQPPDGDPAASSLDFHTALVIAAHNQALLAMFRATRALIQQAFDTLHAQQPDMADAARKTHGELYTAIAAHDAEHAAALMGSHLEEFAARAARYAAGNSPEGTRPGENFGGSRAGGRA